MAFGTLGAASSGSRAKAQVIRRDVPAILGALTTLPTGGLAAPVSYETSGGSGGLSVNSITGTVSATGTPIAVGETRVVTGRIVGADDVSVPFVANLTGASDLNELSLASSTIAESAIPGAEIGAVLGLTPGTTLSLPDDLSSGFALLDGNKIIVGPSDPAVGVYFLRLRETPPVGFARDTIVSIQVVTVTTPLVYPSAQWNGVAGSGFSATPTDPARTTAKPAARLLTPDGQRFAGDMLVGIAAGTHNGDSLTNLGLSKVQVILEGRTVDINAPTVETWVDANGQARSELGWWFMLDHSAFSSDGDAQCYIRAIPADGTMQSRVIGPFTFYRAQTEFDAEATVGTGLAANGTTVFNTITAAYDYFRQQGNIHNPRITVTVPGVYQLGSTTTKSAYFAKGYCTIRATAPITIGHPTFIDDNTNEMRPYYDGLRIQGSNIAIDYENLFSIRHEGSARQHWLDGCRIVNSRGRDGVQALWRKGARGISLLVRGAPWFTEVEVSNLDNAFVGASLVRHCKIERTSWDIMTDAKCIVGNENTNASDAWWAMGVPALDVTYNGANATATIAVLATGGGSAKQSDVDGIVRLVDSVTRDFAISKAESAQGVNYDVQHVADWINQQPGWTATVLDNTRRATALSRAGLKGVGFTAVNAKSTTVQLVTQFDKHDDWFQSNNAGLNENLYCFGNRGTNMSIQVWFFTGTGGGRDYFVVNNAMSADEVDGISQFGATHSGVTFAHNTLTQPLRFASTYVDGGYNLVANNVTKDIHTTSAGNISTRLLNNHQYGGTTLSAKFTNVAGNTVGGDGTSLWAAEGAGNFTPAGELLSNLKPSTLAWDINGNPRVASAPAGAASMAMGAQNLSLLPTIVAPTGSFTLPENAAAGDPAGTLSGVTAGAILSLSDNAGSRVALNGNTVERGATLLDYETNSSHAFTVRSYLPAAANGPYLDTPFTLTVTNVPEHDGPTSYALLHNLDATAGITSTNSTLSTHTGSRKVLGTGGLRVQGNGTAGRSVTIANISSADPATWDKVAFCVDFGDDILTQDTGSFRVRFDIGGTQYEARSVAGVAGVPTGHAIGHQRGKRWYSLSIDRFRTGGDVSLKTTGAVAKNFVLVENNSTGVANTDDLVIDALVLPASHKPMCCITFDDINDAQFTTYYPYMKTKGLVGNCYVPSGFIGTATKMTLAQLLQMQADGWGMATDSERLDGALTAYKTVADAVAAASLCRSEVEALFGTESSAHMCYSFGGAAVGGGGATGYQAITRTVTANNTSQVTTDANNAPYSVGVSSGMPAIGTGVPAGTFVDECPRISNTVYGIKFKDASGNPVVIPSSVTSITFLGRASGLTTTCNGTTTVGVNDSSKLYPGMRMGGHKDIPANTLITVIVDATTITVSNAVPASVNKANFGLETLPFYPGKLQDALIAAGFKSGRINNGTSPAGVYSGYGVDLKAEMMMAGRTMDTPGGSAACITDIQSWTEHGLDFTLYGHSPPVADFNAIIDAIAALRDAGKLDVVTLGTRYRRIAARPGIA